MSNPEIKTLPFPPGRSVGLAGNSSGLDGMRTGEAGFGLIAVVAAMMLHTLLNHYPDALIVVPIFILLGLVPLLVWGHALEVRCFLFSAGLCVLLAALGYGFSQVTSDPEDFFFLSATANIHESIAALAQRVNAPLAVLIWRYVYYAFGQIGVTAAPVIGTSSNALMVGLAGAMTMASVRRIFPADHRVHNFALYAYALCGSPVLFGSLHYRDSYVLFFTTIAVYAWTRAMTSPRLRHTWFAIVASLGMLPLIYYVRVESTYGVILLTAAGFVLKLRRRLGWLGGLALVALPLAAIIYLMRHDLGQMLQYALFRNEQYTAQSLLSSSQNSLGYKYIIDRALPIKLLLGSGYMLYFPIPIWAGFFGNFGTLLTTWNGIYMYFFAPFLIASTILVWRNAWINAEFANCCLLMSLAYWANFFAVIGTSFENRHIGPMTGAMVITGCAIVSTGDKYRRPLRSLQIMWLAGAVLIHLFWRILK